MGDGNHLSTNSPGSLEYDPRLVYKTREGLPLRTTSQKLNLNFGYAMTKAELVDAIAEATGLSKAKAESALKACTGAIEGALRKGDSVSLIGFGTFSVIQRAARTGRNPRDPGKVLMIPASKAVKFKAGSKLKQAVN